MNHERQIELAVKLTEKHVEMMYNKAYKDSSKPPPIEAFKASAMAEIARRVRARAVKIEEDWLHFTRN